MDEDGKMFWADKNFGPDIVGIKRDILAGSLADQALWIIVFHNTPPEN
jgi:hypothetical protein